uniref:Ig-like domain-containing protein n=1 Tax=Lates calcarifer TaxID=8187 RepID=A0A4W6CWK9_LATCA
VTTTQISLLLPSQTVEVQSGEEATLLCSNFTTSPSQIIWFRLTNRTQPRCISSIYTATDPASLCSGVQEGKYEMRSNISTVFLKMKDVDSSDSGLYFCGYYISRHPVIVSATYLKVQGKNVVKCHSAANTKETDTKLLLICAVTTLAQMATLKRLREDVTEGMLEIQNHCMFSFQRERGC